MGAIQLVARALLALIVACSATRGLRAREGDAVDSFAQTGSASKRVSVRQHARLGDVDDEDGGDDEAQENEVQEVRQEVQRGPPMDATSMMLQSSNALLASARAAAEGPDSFAQTGRVLAKTSTGRRVSVRQHARLGDVDDEDGGDDEAQENEVQEVRQEVQRGPPMDATSMMLQSSNALLASARAAAEGPDSFAQTGRVLAKTSTGRKVLTKIMRRRRDDGEGDYEGGGGGGEMEEASYGGGSSETAEAIENEVEGNEESFVQLRRHRSIAMAGDASDDDGWDEEQQDEDDQVDDQVQEVRKGASLGPDGDATQMMLESSSQMVAAANAAASGA